MTRLNSTYNSHLLYPIAQTNHHANHIIHMGTLTRDTSANSKQPSLISDDSVTRVLRVFLEDGVEQSVRLTSLNQLSIILQSMYFDNMGFQRGFCLWEMHFLNLILIHILKQTNYWVHQFYCMHLEVSLAFIDFNKCGYCANIRNWHIILYYNTLWIYSKKFIGLFYCFMI